MSLISDALNKVQQQQQAAQAAAPAPRYVRLRSRLTPRPARLEAALGSPDLLGVNIILVVACLSCGALALRNHPPKILAAWMDSTEPNATAPLGRPAAPPPTVAASPPPPTAPAAASTSFSPAAVPVSAIVEPAPTSDYELAGVTSLGADTLLSISRVRDRRSFWVAVGKSSGGISVVSYDPATDHAVIRVQDRLLRIALRESSPAFGTATTE